MKTSYALALGAVLLIGGYGGWRVFGGQGRQDQPAQPPAVPVTTAESKAADVPVYLRGIGAVQALNAVEAHPQVGGVLVDVPVREGQDVKQGDTLAVIDPRPYKAALDKAQAQLQQDQAQLENAQADLKRYSSLVRSDFASRQQVDTQQSTVSRFQGVIAADKAAIEDAQLNLGFCVLHAPMDGRVGLRRVDPGNLIQANSSGAGILLVVQVHPISVVFTLPEGDLPRVRQARMRGELPVLADSSDGRDELARGTLLTPDNAVNASSGTIQFKAAFDAMLGFYERTLDVALRFQFVTLLVFFATVATTVGLFIIIPKGFFPVQDTGITDAAQDVSFQGVQRLQQKVNELVGQDPAVAGVTSSVVAGSGGQTANNGRLYIVLKPWNERSENASQVVARLSQKMQGVEGIRLFMQPAQDVSVGGRLSRTQYQYTLSDPDGDELNAWAPRVLDKLRTIPGLADVTSDAASSGLTATLAYDKDEAARFGIQPGAIDATLDDAFGQREVTQYFTPLKAYYVILEVTPGQQETLDTLRQLYIRTASGGLVPLSTFVRIDTAPVQPLVVNHQSQFPAVTPRGRSGTCRAWPARCGPSRERLESDRKEAPFCIVFRLPVS